MIVRTFLICRWANSQSTIPEIAAPTDAQWTWVWSFNNANVVSASIVGGTCPAGADGFQLGAIASPGDPKSNIIGIAACGGTETAPFNNGDTALGVIRWMKGMTPVSPWSNQKSVLVQLDPVVQTYIANITNLQGGGGGPFPNMPSLDANTTSALDSFVKGCKSDGNWANMIEVNCILRIAGGVDNLSLAAMPLLLGPLGAPDHALLWIRVAFLEANFTINGLVGVPVNGTRMFGNFKPNGSFKSDTNAGVSIYVSGTANSSTFDLGSFGTTVASACFQFSTNFADAKVRYDCWENSDFNGETQAPAPNLAGFYSASRIGASDTRIFFGNSTNAFAQIGATNVNPLGGLLANCDQVVQLWCTISAGGTPSSNTDRRLSFIAFHDGLTTAQTQLLFNRVQALRVALGGGFA